MKLVFGAWCLALGASAAELPADYRQVEYIESTKWGGSGSELIDVVALIGKPKFDSRNRHGCATY